MTEASWAGPETGIRIYEAVSHGPRYRYEQNTHSCARIIGTGIQLLIRRFVCHQAAACTTTVEAKAASPIVSNYI